MKENFLTIIVHLAVFLPSLVVTVTVALPFFLAITLPLLFTVATLLLLDLYVTVFTFALLGLTVAFSVQVFCLALPFAFRVTDFLFSLTEVTL